MGIKAFSGSFFEGLIYSQNVSEQFVIEPEAKSLNHVLNLWEKNWILREALKAK